MLLKNNKITSSWLSRKDWDKYFTAHQGTIIDLGAGFGADTLYFAQKGYNVIAVDKENNLQVTHPNITFLQQDIAQPVLGNFDGVLAKFSLQYLMPPERLRTVSYYMEHLNPGGVFYILLFKFLVTPYLRSVFPIPPEEFYYTEHDDHLPEGKHTHEIARIVYRKAA